MNDKKYLYISIIIVAIAVCIYFYRQHIINRDIENQSVNAYSESTKSNIAIDINTADINLLTTIPGIGEVTANKILKYREDHQGFDSIEELMNISGIKEKKFAQIKEFIYVSD